MTSEATPLGGATARASEAWLASFVALTKPRITLLSVATALVGLALAPGEADAAVTLALLGGTALSVGSASTLNMYLEREVDAKMIRTRARPLPAGLVRPESALRFGLLQGAAGLGWLTLGANVLTGVLGASALVLYVLVYTPLKQRSSHALFIGAVPGAIPPLLGWVASSGAPSLAGLALFGVVFFWQVPHFLAIALFRRDDYRAAGLKVLPNERGVANTRRTIAVGLVLQVLCTLVLVPLGVGGTVYLGGALVLGAVMLGWGVVGLLGAGDDLWAHRLFRISVVYLPLLFTLLVMT
ncbi:MAG: heme o synthase [Polyangiaceae bacterium]